MKRLIEKLKEEAFFLNKKLELIKMNPDELDLIFKMDRDALMQKHDEIKDERMPFELNKTQELFKMNEAQGTET